MKIGFATADWSNTVRDENNHPVWGGAGWARLGQYVNRLPFKVVYGVLTNNGNLFGVREWDPNAEGSIAGLEGHTGEWKGKDHWDCDVIVMQRWMHSDVAYKIERAKAYGQIIINDLDDWFWGMDPKHHSYKSLFAHNRDPLENLDHYRMTLKRSSVVTVSTPFLADKLCQFVDCPIVIVENYVDLMKFKFPKDHTGNDPVIGWVGATHSRSGDLETVSSALRTLERRGYKFHHSGHYDNSEHELANPELYVPSFAEVTGLNPENVTTSPLVGPNDYPDVFTFDIGIAPVSQVAFNEAKSCIKAMEYAASGVPFVASRFGEYERLRVESGIGRTAKNADQWIKHIEKLSDPDLRTMESDINFARLGQHDIAYGVQAWTTIFNACKK